MIYPAHRERAAYDIRLMSFANPSDPAKNANADDQNTALLIFAKAPVAGRCKTRLAATLGSQRAARIYRAMLEHAVACTRQTFHGPISLVCSPDTRHPFFQRLRRRYAVVLVRQARGDLGQRMHRALRNALYEHSAAVLMGSDQPVLGDDWLEQASRALTPCRAAWLAPTQDGGYWAIGLTRSEARLFRGPRWSGPRVYRRTIGLMRSVGLDVTAHTVRDDIDNGRDWMALEHRRRVALARRATMPGTRAAVIDITGAQDQPRVRQTPGA